jgi:predicted dehydrogenase
MGRRRFLGRSAAALAGAGLAATWGLPLRARSLGSNEAVRIAVAGVRLRGTELADAFRAVPGVRVVAVCDPDRDLVAAAADKARYLGEAVTTCADFRRLLDDKGIDAVAIATPNHWHALMTVWACQARKDVYVEKPVSHTIREGRTMVEAARKYERIVQAGTQNRSDTGLREAVRYLEEGRLGKILLARGFDRPQRTGIGKVDGPQPVPASVDYDLFQGPAALLPLRRRRLHYDWHFFWATGDGDCGNRGIHTLDHVRWAIGARRPPARVVTIGGRFGWDDDGETPNMQVTYFDCEPVPIVYELAGLPARKGAEEMATYRGLRASMVIECEGGFFAGGRGGGSVHDKDGRRLRHFPGDSGVTHQANFVEAVRSRKREQLRAEILEGHLSTTFCHLANISWLTGRRCAPDEVRDEVAGNSVLAEACGRMVEQLRANEVELESDRLVLGLALAFDGERERFVGPGSEWANLYLGRTYRPPYVLPDEV